MATKPVQLSSQTSTVVNEPELGDLALAPVEIFDRTKNIVTKRPIRPGTTSGGMRKEIQEMQTNTAVGM